jgi:hypothetical protein
MKPQTKRPTKRLAIEEKVHAKLKSIAAKKGLKLEEFTHRIIEAGLKSEGRNPDTGSKV